MFQNLIKITRPSNKQYLMHFLFRKTFNNFLLHRKSLTEENSIIMSEFEGNLIRVNSIKSENLPQFLRDLEELNEKLETLLIELYKSDEGG